MTPDVKVCEGCGTEYADTVNFCGKCLLPLVGAARPQGSATQPERPGSKLTEEVLVLESIDAPGVTVTVRSGQVVGRPHGRQDPDVVIGDVPGLQQISGRHARFTLHAGQWYVQHVGGVNWVTVDGHLHQDDEEVPVGDGSTVRLTDSPFRVRIIKGQAP